MAVSNRWGQVVSAVLLAGCVTTTSSPGDGGDSGCTVPLPSPALEPVAACNVLAAALARHEQLACGRLALADVADFTAAQCPEAILGPRELAFDAGRFAYALDAVNQAVQALGALPCAGGNPGSVTSAFSIASPQESQLGWGSTCNGVACDDPLSCGVGQYCQRGTSLQACGVCTDNPALLTPCGGPATGLLCAGGSCNGEECVALVGPNGRCGSLEGVCLNPYACSTGGTCIPPGGIGAFCGNDFECQDSVTIDGGVVWLSCAAQGGSTCQPAPVDGGSCATQHCAPGNLCASVDGGAQDGGWDVCVPFDPLSGGGACVQSGLGPLCPEFETCRDGGCVRRALLGGTCARDIDCALGGCDGGVCLLLAPGQACGSDFACTTQRCDLSGSGACGPACK